MHSFRRYTELIQQIGQAQQRLLGMDQSSIMFQQDSAMVDRLMSESIALRVHLLDPTLVQRLLAFYNWTCSWLVSLATPSRHALISIVPEYLLEDVIDFFVFLGRFNRNALTALADAQVGGLLEFVVTFMSGVNSKFIPCVSLPYHISCHTMHDGTLCQIVLKNPHVRGQLPELLMLFTPRGDLSSLNSFTITNHVFNTHATLRNTLVPALLELYVSCESGGRSAHVDKYSTRHAIHQIFQFLWTIPQHKQTLINGNFSTTEQKPLGLHLIVWYLLC
jgi:hypothetical protein